MRAEIVVRMEWDTEGMQLWILTRSGDALGNGKLKQSRGQDRWRRRGQLLRGGCGGIITVDVESTFGHITYEMVAEHPDGDAQHLDI